MEPFVGTFHRHFHATREGLDARGTIVGSLISRINGFPGDLLEQLDFDLQNMSSL